MRENPVARTLRSGGVALGTFALEFITTGLPRTAASAGAESVVLDQEHSGYTTDVLRGVLAAARSCPLVPLVRVPSVDPQAISAALDLGALGIMVPRVETSEEARRIASAARYPPAGRRGFGILYVDEHGGDVQTYMRHASEEVLIIAQIESEAAVACLDEIAAVDGIDVLWIGQYDLTASIGIPGQFDHPAFLEAVAALVQACEAHGKAAGMATDSLDHARALLEQGFRCLAFGHDLTLYRTALENGIRQLRVDAPARTP